jgi:hypothetical protein
MRPPRRTDTRSRDVTAPERLPLPAGSATAVRFGPTPPRRPSFMTGGSGCRT